MAETVCILLRLTPYRENTLIAATLSPDFGRLDLFLPGAKKTGKKKFPAAGLFRELTVDFKEPREGATLSTPRSVELFQSHDRLADHPQAYMSCCSLAAFLLRNSRNMVGLPLTYRALSVLLKRAEETEEHTGLYCAYVKLVFLHENGFVSVPLERQKVLDQIFSFALGATGEPPPFTRSYTGKLVQWIDALAAAHFF